MVLCFGIPPFHDQAFDIFLEKHNIQLTGEEKRVKIHGKTQCGYHAWYFW